MGSKANPPYDYWTHVVEKIADVYHSLPEEEQEVAGIYVGHYIYAGTIDQIGPQ